MANDPPAVKPWGQKQKDDLQDLIDEGKVDITQTGDTDYINRVRHQYFRERDRDNFRRNSGRTHAPARSGSTLTAIVDALRRGERRQQR